MKHSTSKIYDNCLALSMDGLPLFRCSEIKAQWYVNKGLATVVSDNPHVIQLKFKERGRTDWVADNFDLQPRENICCVCGSTDNLSRHHIVPYCYRKFLSLRITTNSRHVLPLCWDCHKLYELKFSERLKKCFAKIFKAPVDGICIKIDEDYRIAVKYASALVRYRSKIPKTRLIEINDFLYQYFGKSPTYDELTILSKNKVGTKCKSTHGKMITEHINDEEKFVNIWVKHFLRKMKPKFLPKYW